MSTVKFKNGTTRKEGWKGQMTKYSAERLGANKKEVAGFFRVCGCWAVKMAAVQIGQCDGSSQVEVVFHSHPLSFLSQPDTCLLLQIRPPPPPVLLFSPHRCLLLGCPVIHVSTPGITFLFLVTSQAYQVGWGPFFSLCVQGLSPSWQAQGEMPCKERVSGMSSQLLCFSLWTADLCQVSPYSLRKQT